jgi:hypothetical protein
MLHTMESLQGEGSHSVCVCVCNVQPIPAQSDPYYFIFLTPFLTVVSKSESWSCLKRTDGGAGGGMRATAPGVELWLRDLWLADIEEVVGASVGMIVGGGATGGLEGAEL